MNGRSRTDTSVSVRRNAASFSSSVRVGIRPSPAKRDLADLRARSGLTTEQLIYAGRAAGWLIVPALESGVAAQ